MELHAKSPRDFYFKGHALAQDLVMFTGKTSVKNKYKRTMFSVFCVSCFHLNIKHIPLQGSNVYTPNMNIYKIKILSIMGM
jgi:hypothetical protein